MPETVDSVLVFSSGSFAATVERIDRQAAGDAAGGNPQWDAFVSASPYGHLMQTSSWAAFKASFGWDAERLILRKGEAIVGGAQILYRSLPLGLLKLAYVPMGPVVDWQDENLVAAVLEALRRAVRRRKAFCLKLEPAVSGSPALAGRLAGRARRSLHAVQWRSTIEIDLAPSEEELFAQLNKRHRQKIRRAAREGVVVRPGGAEDISSFQGLLAETARRKDFSVYPPEYYRAAYERFVAESRGAFLVASYQGAILAGIMVFVAGFRAYCFYGATGNAFRQLMPAYLLHWEGLRWAREHGCRLYDYCGVPDEDEPTLETEFVDRDDGLWGVYRFKRGFGGQVVRYLDTHDMVFRRWLYWFYDRAILLLRRIWGETWHRRFFSG